jgi:hypothetical protein
VQINLKVDKDNVILVFSKGCLHALSSIDGEVLWEKDFSAERFKQLNFDVSNVLSLLTSSYFDLRLATFFAA